MCYSDLSKQGYRPPWALMMDGERRERLHKVEDGTKCFTEAFLLHSTLADDQLIDYQIFKSNFNKNCNNVCVPGSER